MSERRWEASRRGIWPMRAATLVRALANRSGSGELPFAAGMPDDDRVRWTTGSRLREDCAVCADFLRGGAGKTAPHEAATPAKRPIVNRPQVTNRLPTCPTRVLHHPKEPRLGLVG